MRDGDTTIRGRVKRFRFQKPGFAIAEVERLGGNGGSGEIFTAVGALDTISEGEEAKLEGEWQLHPKFGEQFRVRELTLTVPRDERGVIGFLERLPQIGPQRAKLICEHFGAENVFAVIESEPEQLAAINGITAAHVSEITESYAAQRERRDLIVSLKKIGLTDWQQSKVYEWAAELARKNKEERSPHTPNHAARKRYIEDALANDPYQWTSIRGFGFATVDRIALAAGVKRSSPNRARAAIEHALEQAEAQGHCYLPGKELLGLVDKLTGIRGAPAMEALKSLRGQGRVIYRNYHGSGDEPDVYGYRLEAAESYLASFFAERRFDSDLFGHVLERAKDVEIEIDGHALNLQQRQAVLLGGCPDIGALVITGGPGTGKTTILKAVCTALEDNKCTVALASPTGKAAKRLAEQTGREASTLHRLLRWSAGDGGWGADETDPIPYDVLIVDEASMIDVELCAAVCSAVSESTRIIFVGDVDQLPSIGPGSVLRDLLESYVIATVRLTEVYRQSENSYINVNAQLMNRGRDLQLDPQAEDFFWFPCRDADEAFDRAVRLVTEDAPRRHQLDPIRDIQVLAPQRKGDIGIYRFNAELQGRLNAPQPHRVEVRSPKGATFRVGDKVRHIKNNYDLGVFNGEVGVIDKIRVVRDGDTKRTETVVDYGDRKVVYPTQGALVEMVLNYASTVHSSQGSEYPAVVVLCHSYNSFMLSRNLIYTAITRARQAVYLVGDERGLRRALKNADVAKRYTQLATRIREAQTP